MMTATRAKPIVFIQFVRCPFCDLPYPKIGNNGLCKECREAREVQLNIHDLFSGEEFGEDE